MTTGSPRLGPAEGDVRADLELVRRASGGRDGNGQPEEVDRTLAAVASVDAKGVAIEIV